MSKETIGDEMSEPEMAQRSFLPSKRRPREAKASGNMGGPEPPRKSDVPWFSFKSPTMAKLGFWGWFEGTASQRKIHPGAALDPHVDPCAMWRNGLKVGDVPWRVTKGKADVVQIRFTQIHSSQVAPMRRCQAFVTDTCGWL